MDLSTSMMGLRLAHPFVAGASPLGRELDSVKRLEDSGAAAIVLPSLFEEQVTLASEGRIRHHDVWELRGVVSIQHFPSSNEYAFTPDQYAEHVARVRRTVSIPVIGSLNGTTAESWLTFSRLIEQAGAHGLELNLYEVVADPKISSAAIEHQIVHLAAELKQFLKIPVAIKLSPFFASIGNVVTRLDEAGAAAVVMFNRFYQPDFDINTLHTVIDARLSSSSELLLRLRWLAILFRRVKLSLIASGGVACAEDGIKALLAGADAVQVASALLRHGPGYFATLRGGLATWMERHSFSTLDDVRGRMSLRDVDDPSAFERAHYLRALNSWKAENL
ncbi:MAG TPA: dihydroorotate dehydrogenase-like protein [Vicinamibacterales bacterium]|nr:dihydroorotate dehydrogenase-like protein [Vicinamibacterales bacterium]